jgi:hypothetical protein
MLEVRKVNFPLNWSNYWAPQIGLENLHLQYWESVNSGLDYWNGLLDWTTGLTFDLEFSHENYNIIMEFCRITISYMVIWCQ